MWKPMVLGTAILSLLSCVTPPATTTSIVSPQQQYHRDRAAATTPVSAYAPIDVTPAMKAGMTSTRPFELIYALGYATNRTDKAVPETFGGLSSMIFNAKVGNTLRFEVITDQGHFGMLDAPDALIQKA
jgi:hypothetical protein